MEELAKLEAERGNPAYLPEQQGIKEAGARVASNRGDVCEYTDSGGVL